jgi:hypothetical protein
VCIHVLTGPPLPAPLLVAVHSNTKEEALVRARKGPWATRLLSPEDKSAVEASLAQDQAEMEALKAQVCTFPCLHRGLRLDSCSLVGGWVGGWGVGGGSSSNHPWQVTGTCSSGWHAPVTAPSVHNPVFLYHVSACRHKTVTCIPVHAWGCPWQVHFITCVC